MKKDLSEVFLHNLHRIYFVEKHLVDALEELSEKVSSDEIRKDFKTHRKETVGHVAGVEQVFHLLGINPKEERTEIISVMNKELRSTLKVVSAETKDFFILESAANSERLEISYYETLILSIKDLDLEYKDKILTLLRLNLSEEEAALSTVIHHMKKQAPLFKRSIH